MPRPEQRRPPKNWQPHRDLSPEGKAFTATHPSLYLHVWCNFSGVHCVAHVDWLNEKGKLVRIEIAKASWRPPEVTETLVVEWGKRALARWLESRHEAG